MKRGKNEQHMTEKHPFQFSSTSGRGGNPPMGKSGGCHPNAGGSVGKFRSANSAMKGK